LLGHFTGISRAIPVRPSIWFKQQIVDRCILRRPCENGYGTHGYLLNLSGAKKLYSLLNKIELPVDHYTGSDKYVNLYIIENPIITSDSELAAMSSIEEERLDLGNTILYVPQEGIKAFVKKVIISLGLYNQWIRVRRAISINLKKIKRFKIYQ